MQYLHMNVQAYNLLTFVRINILAGCVYFFDIKYGES